MNSVVFQSGWIGQTILSDVLIVGLIFVVSQLATKVVRNLHQLRKIQNAVPSPKSHWLFGHIFSLPATHDGYSKRVELMKKFPALFLFNLGPFISVVHVHHPETVKAVLKSGASKGFVYRKILGHALGQGLLSSNGATWQHHRRMLAPTFHLEMLKLYVKVFNETICEVLNWLDDVAVKKEARDITKQFKNLTFNNLTQCIMSQPATDQGEALPYSKALDVIAFITIQRFQNPLLWPDRIFFLTSKGKKFKEACDTMHSAVRKIIQDRKQLLASSTPIDKEDVTSLSDDGVTFTFQKRNKKRVDFLDILLQTKVNENEKGLNEQELLDEVSTFFTAGQETTANAMDWATYLFTLHQDWQEKCRQEVLDVCGVDGDIEWSSISKLTSLALFIKETLRLYPTGSIVGRELTEPLTFNDPYCEGKSVTFPAGTKMMLNFFMLHRHPGFWENPEVFDPERFTFERSKDRNVFAYLPFSGSSRNCIGQNFGLYQIKVTFAQILRKYRLLPSPDSPRVVMEIGASLHTKYGIHVKVEKI